AQIGQRDYEVPFGPTIPAYYGLIASRYMHVHGISEADLAEFAVLMRAHAALHPGAQFRTPISIAEVLASRPIAAPLKLLDCCPVSDGAAALVVSAAPGEPRICIAGAAQTHPHQHVSSAADLAVFGLAGLWPLNTHGGLLSFGHSGVAGGLAHLVEAGRQLAGRAGARQVRQPDIAFLHGDGGVMSSHVSLVLRRE